MPCGLNISSTSSSPSSAQPSIFTGIMNAPEALSVSIVILTRGGYIFMSCISLTTSWLIDVKSISEALIYNYAVKYNMLEWLTLRKSTRLYWHTLALLGLKAMRHLSVGCPADILSDPWGSFNLNRLKTSLLLRGYWYFNACKHNSILLHQHW